MCSFDFPSERSLVMKCVRSVFALSLVLGLFTLVAAWPALGQPSVTTPVPAGGLAPVSPFGQWVGGKPQDPEMAKIHEAEASAHREVQSLMREYKATEDADKRDKIKTKLSAALAKQFDAQQKRRDLELTRVETQLKKLRELMKKRGEERKTIIERRVDQLVRDAEGLGWAPPPGPATANPAAEPSLLWGRPKLPQ
jgi:hypothetical protein